MAVSAAGFCLLVIVQAAAAAPPKDACDLPQDLQGEITSKYPGAKLVSLLDLGEHGKGLFQKDHGNACPGSVKVDFYGDGKPTLALVLITKDRAKQKSQLVVAREMGGTWKARVLDTVEGWPVPVVWREDPGEYQDVYGEKKIRARTPVIVFCGYEAWAILYAWTGKNVTKIWIAD